MHTIDFINIALFEHRFWLQILGDHSRFIHDSLAPSEIQDIQRARHFITVFDNLLAQVRQPQVEIDLDNLTRQAYQSARDLREFKLDLLRRHLAGQIKISLTPTFINHMINELIEYLLILGYLLKGQVPPAEHPVHHHQLWLLDAEGHAAYIAASLDMVERMLIEKAKIFRQHFDDFYDKAIEIAGYLRTNLKQFPALTRFNRQVEAEILLFQEFLVKLLEMLLQNQVLGILSPLVPDHMFREECYFLIKLAGVSEVRQPACDPTKPRVQP